VLLGGAQIGNDRKLIRLELHNVNQRPHASAAEFAGTAFLLAAIVGSGIMGESLANGNAAIALLANSLATGAMLFVLISVFSPMSGAHLNPIISAVMVHRREQSSGEFTRYVLAQLSGAFVGVASANIMFESPPFTMSQHTRAGEAQMFSEFVATFGLVMVVLLCNALPTSRTAFVVSGYITAAYWFTASTSFANPAVTVARAFTDSFSGIRLIDAPAFVFAQVLGAASAVVAVRFMLRRHLVSVETKEAGKGTA
jgi:glycerol uptake facilitator-like aquaporin